MDTKKMGELIAEIRKEKSMTQRELAERLNVTDKAVSKWERGNGYPEIEILPVLAEALGITINELFSGQRNTSGSVPLMQAEEILSETIEYAGRENKQKAGGIAFSIISAIFLVSAFIGLLCNYIISGKFDWSLYQVGGLLVVWLTLAPAVLLKRHRAVSALAGLTASVIPYLFLVETLCPAKGWVIPMALPVIGISVAGLLVSIFLFVYTKLGKLYSAAITLFLIGAVINLGVGKIVDGYLQTEHNNIPAYITVMSTAFASVLLALFAYVRHTRHQA